MMTMMMKCMLDAEFIPVFQMFKREERGSFSGSYVYGAIVQLLSIALQHVRYVGCGPQRRKKVMAFRVTEQPRRQRR